MDILSNQDSSYTSLENEILSFWKDNKIYEKISKDSSSNGFSNESSDSENLEKSPIFRFMDGPPFVSSNCLHFGHLMIGFLKSTILNYQQMKGMKCLNELGYDCHGLPVEMVANKKLNINGPEDIEKIGIATYNKECKDMIHNFSGQWTPIFERIGRFADFDKTYKTMDTNFMESVWWSFSELWKKNLVYRGYKVMPFSTACNSALSNFEAGQNYKEIETKSVYITFELNISFNNKPAYIAVWTTTPWTLPANLAICLNSEGVYSLIELEDKIIICGENYKDNILNNIIDIKDKNFKILGSKTGKDLKGISYKPIFDDFIVNSPYIIEDKVSDIYTLLCDSYVDMNSSVGTGAVHLAPAFGEDDFRVCLEHNIITPETIGDFCPVNDEGKFTSEIKDFEGMLVSNKDTNDEIIKALKIKGNFIKTFMYKHSYPFCYRTDTPLIYRAISSYFVKVSSIKDKLLKNNEKINWIPSNIGAGRFKNWLENAKDWNISRSRYFGTPIPVWVSDDFEEVVVIGSVEELKSATCFEGEITDLHREFIDNLTIPSKMGKGVLKRINDVFDCWYESGCVPYGQIHYPFENKDLIDECGDYLSDFIAEGLDQTRGWFYTLLVLSTALFDKPAFKNVICTGLIMDEKGMKFSKKYGNFKDPMEILNKYGADYLRLYLLSSPTSHAEPLYFKENQIFEVKQTMIPYINAVKFFMTQYIDMKKGGNDILSISGIFENGTTVLNPIDKWIITKQAKLVKFVNENMTKFNVDSSIEKSLDFIEDLTNSYIKLNRERMRGLVDIEERKISLSVLYFVLINYIKMMTPMTPFLSEYLYQNIKRCCGLESKDDIGNLIPKSCFMEKYPVYEDFMIFEDALTDFNIVQELIKNVRTLRCETKNHSSLKVPISNLIVSNNSTEYLNIIEFFKDVIMEELNIMNIDFQDIKDNISYIVKPNHKIIGSKFRKDASKVKELLASLDGEQIMKLKIIGEINIEGYDIKNDVDVSIEAVPCLQSFGESYVSKIFDTTMLSIDTTYNEETHKSYSIRSAITSIQRFRREIGINPWDKITIEIYEAPKEWVDSLDYFIERFKCDVKLFSGYLSLDSPLDYEKFNSFNYEPYSKSDEKLDVKNPSKIYFRILKE